MGGAIRHAFHSGRADGPNDGRVQPSGWDADHDVPAFVEALFDLSLAPLTFPYVNAAGAADQSPLTPLMLALLAKGDAAAARAVIGAASLVSPSLDGVPTAPTPALGANTNQIATMAALAQMRADLVASSPATMDTLKELADALGDDPNFATTMATALGYRLRFDVAQILTSGQKAQALANLGLALAAVASSGQYADLANRPTLGTAAALDVGTAALKVLQLDASGKIPAVDGSQISGILAGASSGGIVRTTSGNFVTPANTRATSLFKFVLTAGGGAGGNGSTNNVAGCGAGAGETVIGWVTGLAANANCAFVAGPAGVKNTGLGATGNDAANSTFTIGGVTYTANGGKGGNTSSVNGGLGGTGGNGAVNIPGGDGDSDASGLAAYGRGGKGGGSYWGGGGWGGSGSGSTVTLLGGDAKPYGAGGGGGGANQADYGRGGNGGPPILTVEWTI